MSGEATSVRRPRHIVIPLAPSVGLLSDPVVNPQSLKYFIAVRDSVVSANSVDLANCGPSHMLQEVDAIGLHRSLGAHKPIPPASSAGGPKIGCGNLQPFAYSGARADVTISWCSVTKRRSCQIRSSLVWRS